MSHPSPEKNAIIRAYLEREANKKIAELEQSGTPVETEVDTSAEDAAAQTMVDELFAHANKISAEEYKKIPTLADLQEIVNNLNPGALRQIKRDLLPEKNLNEALNRLKALVSGQDYITKLQNKAALDACLRHTIIEIINTTNEEIQTERMRRSGLIYFDVRGLKMVNDARQNHADGDRFISRVADETKTVAEQIFAPILGSNSVSGIFRDGGDEFAIAFDNSDFDLEAPLTSEEIDGIFPESVTVTRKGVETVVPIREIAKKLATPVNEADKPNTCRLVDVLAKILKEMMFEQKFVDENFPRELIEVHLKKGQPEYNNDALRTFDMPILIATGAQTNFEVFKQVKYHYLKKIKTAEEIAQMPAAEVVNILMSATRICADRKSYSHKDAQNKEWQDSDDPFFKLLLDLVSRNEITLNYAEALRLAKNAIYSLHLDREAEIQRQEELAQAAKIAEDANEGLRINLATTFANYVATWEEVQRLRAQIAQISKMADNP